MRTPRAATKLLAHLVLVIFTVMTLFPVILVLKKSFSEGQDFAVTLSPIPEAATLQQFRDVTGHHLFLRQLLNSAIAAAGTTVVGVFLACTAAYAFSRFRFPGHRAGMMVFLAVQMFPATLLMIPLYVLLDRLGLLDHVLGLVLVYSTSAIPFCVWMLKGYFDTIPKELEEAARIDGASRFGIFFRIMLPLGRPAIAVTALFSFMTAWNEFIMASTFTSRERAYTLPVMLQHYVGAFTTEWGHFAAGAIIVSLPVMALFYILQKHLVAGLTAGSVKG
jgi:arabinogalactan oligomer/maltooligosaccharide transport system permease protein